MIVTFLRKCRSSREENDEEALKWAALEKLPTFDRLKKGLLFGSTGRSNEVNIDDLGMEDRKRLLDRLVNAADEDNEKFLLRLRNRIDRVGIELPKIEVRFEHLSVEADVNSGSRALPSFFNFNFGVVEVSGKVTNNGHEFHEFVPMRTSAYISQHDVHIGEMTVRETLAISGQLQGVGSHYAASKGQEANVVTDYTIKILGLDVCADTLVGDGMIRGEMIVGPSKVLLMDEISTGLDSSTTFQIVNPIKHYVHILEGTALISLLQPAPETYALFDDIILVSDGKIMYEGSRENVLEFFESMGFKCPERKAIADFLQEVTSKKDQRQYWMTKNEPYRFVTAKEFANAYKSFHVGRRLANELSTPYDKSKSHPAALTTEKYGLNTRELLKACFDREVLLVKRNSFVFIFKLVQIIILAIVSTSVFFRTEMHRHGVEDGGQYVSALFFGVNMVMFNGMAEIPMTIAKLPVFYKQRDFFVFPSWVYAIPTMLVKIPFSFLDSGVWTILTYYLIGFDPNIWRFLKHYLLLTLSNIMASWLFRFIGAVGRNMIVANTVGSFSILVLFALGGFILNQESYWYWLAVTVMLGYTIIYNFCYVLSLSFLNTFEKIQSNAPEQEDDVDLSSMRNEESANKKRGMVLPFEAQSITFDNIKYSVDMPQCFSTILMGVSDAGKTTLMDVPAGRKTGGIIEVDIRISGYPKKQETFTRISRYCEQNDIHSPHVTVYESLIYSAWLRLPADVDENARKMFVDEVMELVELRPVMNALVGLPGLDARAAAIVMRTVRNTVDTGRTVVCTINQPSIDIFEAFDELFLMKRGGQEIYVGPVGHESCDLIKYFEDIEGVSKITNGYNPATWMLEVTTSSQELALGVDFTEIYKNSELYTRNKALINELSQSRPDSSDLHFPTPYSRSFFTQCLACLWKQRASYWRNTPYTAVRFAFTTFIALFFGSIFWDLGSKRKSIKDLGNSFGALYVSVIFLGVQNASAVQPVVDIERTVFYRERAAGMYSELPYAFDQVLVEIPYVFAQVIAFGLLVYSMLGFDWTVEKFFWFLYFMFTCWLFMTFYGMMTVVITPNASIAVIVAAAAFYGFWNLFCGFIIPRTKIPIWWRWYYWANPLAWTLYGVIVSQYGDFDDVLTNGEIVKERVRSWPCEKEEASFRIGNIHPVLYQE
ncbi:hypothetical protein L1987_49611 [Smallanthus sonchifolius]|uniref:Uncharacterized protein n=1 Tax=Smallanthus sonchifolius TaxID=185202 RepID=A0ACB9FUK0_9ASTR|nr:hypothetical protein L1987_49611 [Smallanthus sonchifolius]